MIANKDDITILYVEDEPGIRDSLKGFLNYFCDKLYVASDGVEGLELYKKHNPDIVISDIKMPNMNGIEMAKAIKKEDERQHVIFTTAHSESDYFMEAINLQVDGYILKPIDLDKLEQKIQHTIEHINLKKNYKKQQTQLVQSEKLASMGEMIGNIAHQWRQPLSIISTGVTGMQIQKEYNNLTNKDFNETCEMIDKTTQYLSQTIDDFTNFIKGEAVKQQFCLKELLESTLKIIEPNLKSHNITLVKNISKEIIINSYPNDLKQSLINIFNNSKDAIEDITKQNSIYKEENKKYIFLTLEEKENNAIITIKDNGGGIQEDIINKIYEPYFTTKHQSQGTGLGLYMAFDIITNSLKGKIQEENVKYSYDNNDYIGAEFIISLPININKKDEK